MDVSNDPKEKCMKQCTRIESKESMNRSANKINKARQEMDYSMGPINRVDEDEVTSLIKETLPIQVASPLRAYKNPTNSGPKQALFESCNEITQKGRDLVLFMELPVEEEDRRVLAEIILAKQLAYEGILIKELEKVNLKSGHGDD